MTASALLVAAVAMPAAADVDAAADGSAISLRLKQEAARDQDRAQREQARSVAMGPVAITTLVIACQGNGPGANEQTGLFCDASRLGCQNTPEPGDILYWRWPGTRFPDGTVQYGTSPAGTTCLGTDEAAAAAATPVMTLADFRRLPLPPGTPTVQPGTGRVLVNVPTNVYVTAEPVQLQTTLLDQPVTVQATPATYTWDFGDGTTLGPTPDAGGPYPP